MKFIDRVIFFVIISVYALAISLAFFSELSIYETTIPALFLDLILTISYLLILLKKEKSNRIELYWSTSSSSFSKWFFLTLLIVLSIFQIIYPTDYQGFIWLGLISIRLLEKLHPKLNWDLMIEKNTIIFPTLWEKNIVFSEIDNLEICEDGLEIKLNNRSKKLHLTKAAAESLRIKIKSA